MRSEIETDLNTVLFTALYVYIFSVLEAFRKAVLGRPKLDQLEPK